LPRIPARYYGQQSCTAGRAAFMGGTVPVRTGMTKVGLPGAKEGWQKSDPTIAALLKAQGYATGQFGKNHFVFLENRGQAFGVWREPFTELRVPLLFHLRRDPFEKAQHNSNTYNDWFLERPFVIVPIQALAARFLQTMKEYPPSQAPGSFNLSKIEEQLRRAQ
jgi:hypothetical protein